MDDAYLDVPIAPGNLAATRFAEGGALHDVRGAPSAARESDERGDADVARISRRWLMLDCHAALKEPTRRAASTVAVVGNERTYVCL
jgi:hypothetical protein